MNYYIARLYTRNMYVKDGRRKNVTYDISYAWVYLETYRKHSEIISNCNF